ALKDGDHLFLDEYEITVAIADVVDEASAPAAGPALDTIDLTLSLAIPDSESSEPPRSSEPAWSSEPPWSSEPSRTPEPSWSAEPLSLEPPLLQPPVLQPSVPESKPTRVARLPPPSPPQALAPPPERAPLPAMAPPQVLAKKTLPASAATPATEFD